MPPARRHVALNALFLDPGRSGGPETYLRGLVPAIARLDPRLELTLLTTRRGASALRADGWTDFARVVALPFDEGQRVRRLLGEEVQAWAAALRHRAGLLHSLASIGPVLAPLPTVLTLHDVTFMHHRTFPRSTTLAMTAIVRGAARTADAILCVSAAAADDIAATLGLDRSQLRVVPNGHGRPPSPAPARPEAEVRAELRLGAGERVVLCVAAVRPHKNQGLLVRALEHLPEDVVCVLAGAHEGYAAEVEALAAQLGVAGRLRMPGYLADDVLEGLWGLAACAAFPTRAEGFGLPVLEALDRGVPVACADIPVLHEVGGELPRYFGVDDPAGADAAITAARTEPFDAVAARAAAAAFSWEATARGTVAAYDEVLGCTSG